MFDVKAVEVFIQIALNDIHLQGEGLEGMITLEGEDIDYDPDDSFHQIRSEKPVKQPTPDEAQDQGEEIVDTGDTFPVVIAVERALHLPLISNKAR